jgi:hypothetical protein
MNFEGKITGATSYTLIVKLEDGRTLTLRSDAPIFANGFFGPAGVKVAIEEES